MGHIGCYDARCGPMLSKQTFDTQSLHPEFLCAEHCAQLLLSYAKHINENNEYQNKTDRKEKHEEDKEDIDDDESEDFSGEVVEEEAKNVEEVGPIQKVETEEENEDTDSDHEVVDTRSEDIGSDSEVVEVKKRERGEVGEKVGNGGQVETVERGLEENVEKVEKVEEKVEEVESGLKIKAHSNKHYTLNSRDYFLVATWQNPMSV